MHMHAHTYAYAHIHTYMHTYVLTFINICKQNYAQLSSYILTYKHIACSSACLATQIPTDSCKSDTDIQSDRNSCLSAYICVYICTCLLRNIHNVRIQFFRISGFLLFCNFQISVILKIQKSKKSWNNCKMYLWRQICTSLYIYIWM